MSSRSKGPSNASRSSSSSRTTWPRLRLAAGSDASARHGHGGRRLGLALVPTGARRRSSVEELPPDEQASATTNSTSETQALTRMPADSFDGSTRSCSSKKRNPVYRRRRARTAPGGRSESGGRARAGHRRRADSRALRRGRPDGTSRSSEVLIRPSPGSISSPQAGPSASPKSSWFHQLPTRPIACAMSSPGAAASRSASALAPERCATIAPTITPSPIPPQIPRPPFQTANGPHHSSGTSSQLVAMWYSRAPTMPAPTPHTATRKIRSQSPPRCTQRTPVSAMQAAMPRSSIRPYMWIVIGPRSSVPDEGEGMEARNVIRQSILPRDAKACR